MSIVENPIEPKNTESNQQQPELPDEIAVPVEDEDQDTPKRYRKLKHKYNCLEFMINAALVVLPTMFIFPVVTFVLQRAGIINFFGITSFEPLLSYYFVLCWVTVFMFSFVYCFKSIYDNNFFAAFDISNRAANPGLPRDMNELGYDDYSGDFDDDGDSSDYPPTYSASTGYCV